MRASFRCTIGLAMLGAAGTPVMAIDPVVFDSFPGTVLNQAVWEGYGGGIEQNEKLTFSGLTTRDYTTRYARVGVGGTVQVDVTYRGGDGDFGLYLTNNSAGKDTTLGFDTAWFGLGGGKKYFYGSYTTGVPGSGVLTGPIVEVGDTTDVTYTLSIRRATQQVAALEILDSTGNRVGFTGLAVPVGLPLDMYVALGSSHCTVEFDNVVMSGNVIAPEPAGLCLVAAGCISMLPRRRR